MPDNRSHHSAPLVGASSSPPTDNQNYEVTTGGESIKTELRSAIITVNKLLEGRDVSGWDTVSTYDSVRVPSYLPNLVSRYILSIILSIMLYYTHNKLMLRYRMMPWWGSGNSSSTSYVLRLSGVLLKIYLWITSGYLCQIRLFSTLMEHVWQQLLLMRTATASFDAPPVVHQLIINQMQTGSYGCSKATEIRPRSDRRSLRWSWAVTSHFINRSQIPTMRVADPYLDPSLADPSLDHFFKNWLQ